MLPIISDLIESTVGKVIDKVVNLIPLSESEKEKIKIETLKIIAEEQKELNSQIDIINQTIQTEIKSDRFIVYSWRPFLGYIFCLTIFVNYILGAFISIPKIEIPQEVWYGILTILGISSTGRSIEKILKIKR